MWVNPFFIRLHICMKKTLALVCLVAFAACDNATTIRIDSKTDSLRERLDAKLDSFEQKVDTTAGKIWDSTKRKATDLKNRIEDRIENKRDTLNN